MLIRFVGSAHWRRVIGAPQGGVYRWRAGDVVEVDDETGAYCLAEPGGAFELVETSLTPAVSQVPASGTREREEEEETDEWEDMELWLKKRGG